MSGTEKVLMKSEEKRSLADVARFLRELADKIERNQLTLHQGGEEIVLELTDPLTLELKLEEEDKGTRTKHQFEIELEWYPGEAEEGISLGS
ncbi:MAG: amphi-Trp domain-containing protein [Anaerolineales bacterium]